MNEADIFARVVLEKDAGRRSELIRELCADDVDLRARIQRLVQAHENPDSFVARPVAFGDSSIREQDAGEKEAGDRGFDETIDPASFDPVQLNGGLIGPYKLLQKIGEGGMGMVYMAEQTHPVKRRVALKVIKPGMDSRQVVARFEAERQALAMMDHPNIARVLDAGTTSQGHPYFVMELVNGIPVTEYCDREKLAPRDRLELFETICRGVQHAHQKGVIHRDLKPSNILVCEYDGVAVPKIIDFGVAKATGAQLTDKTLFTEFGQIVGTLEYMSPEQARRNQLDVDTRSDIYSLGIVLYALLTGETPFGRKRLREAAWDEMLQIIREEEPLRPSLKISSSVSLSHVAERRSTEPARLSRFVQGDLDWIVMKTLQKDRNQRYASANELADEVARFLNHEPLIARPPTLVDRAARFIQANYKLLTALLLVLLATGAIFAVYQAGAESRRRVGRARTEQVQLAIGDARQAIVKAELSDISDESAWDAARAFCERLEDLAEEDGVTDKAAESAGFVVNEFNEKLEEHQIEVQLEEVLIANATEMTLESWTEMEAKMNGFFAAHGFNLDSSNAEELGRKINRHPSAVLWADLLELWIATKAQLSMMGGPAATRESMQPWAEAIYLADTDPIRTGIRRFYYEGQTGREDIEQLIADAELAELPPRTLAWLGHTYRAIALMHQDDTATARAIEVFDVAIRTYPRNFMVAHDAAALYADLEQWGQATRMYHRCIAIRDDVPGIWMSLADALTELGEDDNALKAKVRALELDPSLEAELSRLQDRDASNGEDVLNADDALNGDDSINIENVSGNGYSGDDTSGDDIKVGVDSAS